MPAILTALGKSKNKDVQRIIGLLDDCDPGQEKGVFNNLFLVATVMTVSWVDHGEIKCFISIFTFIKKQYCTWLYLYKNIQV